MRRIAWPDPALLIAAVDTPQTAKRDAARRQVRQALQQLLAERLGNRPELIEQPGQPLHLAAPHTGIGLSVSHEVGLSLLAIHFTGPVGIDLLALTQLPAERSEIERLSADYLGERISSPYAFARAWVRHEATLKCQGKALHEWPTATVACQLADLALPAGYVGSVAMLKAAENPTA